MHARARVHKETRHGDIVCRGALRRQCIIMRTSIALLVRVLLVSFLFFFLRPEYKVNEISVEYDKRKLLTVAQTEL